MLRGISICAVIVYHANKEWLPGGFLGVDVFFVVSGFIITLQLIGEVQQTGRINLVDFWIRRIRRIVPVLILVLCLVLLGTRIFVPEESASVRTDSIYSLFFLGNWYQLFADKSYFDFFTTSPLRHLWSLAIEEQFYLVWPPIMSIFVIRYRKSPHACAFFCFFLAVLLCGIGAAIFVPGSTISDLVTPSHYLNLVGKQIAKTDFLFLNSLTRGSGLFVGAALGLLVGAKRETKFKFAPDQVRSYRLAHWSPAIFTAIVSMFFLFQTNDNREGLTGAGYIPLYRGGFLGVALIAALAIYSSLGLSDESWIRSRVASALGWLGKRSYGLYLIHWPLFQFHRTDLRIPLSVPWFFVLSGVSVVLAEISFRLFENPLRRESPAIARRPSLQIAKSVLVASVLGIVILVLIPQGSLRDDLRASLESGQVAVDDVSAILAATNTRVPIAIGDSVMLGAAESLVRRGIAVDAAINRDFNYFAQIMQSVEPRKFVGRTVVIHLTNNTEVSSEQLNRVVTKYLSKSHVVILDSYVPKMPYDQTNSNVVRSFVKHMDNVTLADWRSVASINPQFFLDDGLHLNQSGQEAYADLIMQAIGK